MYFTILLYYKITKPMILKAYFWYHTLALAALPTILHGLELLTIHWLINYLELFSGIG